MSEEQPPAAVPSEGKAKKEKKVKEAKPPPPGGYAKKPQLTKAERREQQEKQRAAKTEATTGNTSGSAPRPGNSVGSVSKKTGDLPIASSSGQTVAAGSTTAVPPRPKHLFAHLAPFTRKTSESLGTASSLKAAHPAVVALGLQYASGAVRGADARCVAMLEAMKCVVRDYETPPGRALERDLDKKIDRSFQFLTDCRPHSVSMGNAKQFLRGVVRSLDPNLPEQEAKQQVCEEVDRFVRERVEAAGRLIAALAVDKLRDVGDVVLTFGRSHAVEQVLFLAHARGKAFHVVVVDARPSLEGKGLLERLTQAGVPCTYCWLNALSYAMPNVTKVLLGAAAVMSNGAVQARAGTAVVAMTAKARNVPVIFTCETYKLCEKVSLDSVVSNELGDPAELAQPKHTDGAFASLSTATAYQGGGHGASPLSEGGGGVGGGGHGDNDDTAGGFGGNGGGGAGAGPRILNLRYDLTPIKFVGFVVTEVGMIPPTAVPALLREYRREDNSSGIADF